MKQKPLISTIFVSILFIIGLVGVNLSQNYFRQHDNTYTLNYNWSYRLNGKSSVSLTLPTHVDHYFKKGDIIDLYTILPRTSIKKPYVYTTLYLQYAKIFLEDDLIYEYKGNLTPLGTTSVGSGCICIPLPEDYVNKTLHIQYTHAFDHITNYLFPIALKTGDLSSTLFHEKAETLYINGCFFIYGLFCMGVSIYLLLKRQPFIGTFSLGVFGINTSIWFLCNTKCLQLFTTNLILIHNLEYFCFYFLCIPLWLFFYYNVSNPFLKKYCLFILIPSITFFIGANILEYLGVVNFFQLLTLYHALLIVSILMLIIITCLLLYYHHPLANGSLIGILCLVVSGILELIKFYSTNIHIRSFFNYGMILFIVSLSLSLFNTQDKFTQILANRSIYQNK